MSGLPARRYTPKTPQPKRKKKRPIVSTAILHLVFTAFEFIYLLHVGTNLLLMACQRQMGKGHPRCRSGNPFPTTLNTHPVPTKLPTRYALVRLGLLQRNIARLVNSVHAPPLPRPPPTNAPSVAARWDGVHSAGRSRLAGPQ